MTLSERPELPHGVLAEQQHAHCRGEGALYLRLSRE